MNKPQVLIKLAKATPFRSGQALTHLCQLLPPAVLLSARSLTQEQTCHARPSDDCGFLVKNVRISLFKFVFSQVFTLSPAEGLR